MENSTQQQPKPSAEVARVMFALIPPYTGDVAAPHTGPGEEDDTRQGPGGENYNADTQTDQ